MGAELDNPNSPCDLTPPIASAAATTVKRNSRRKFTWISRLMLPGGDLNLAKGLFLDGTSFATPRVAGVLALIFSEINLDGYPDPSTTREISTSLMSGRIDAQGYSHVDNRFCGLVTRNDLSMPAEIAAITPRPPDFQRGFIRPRLAVDVARLIQVVNNINADIESDELM